MKRITVLAFVFVGLLSAESYMAKIEPYDKFNLYSKTDGEIVYIDNYSINSVVDKVVLKVENTTEKKKLNIEKKKLQLKKKELLIKKDNYNIIVGLNSKSKLDKDSKFIEILQIESALLNMQNTVNDLEYDLDNKSIHVKNLYIKKFLVNKGDYINKGTKIAELYDISSSKLTIYLNTDDLKNINKKKIYIDGKVSDSSKILRIDKTVDNQYISLYKVDIKSDIKEFGKIVEVEIK